MIKKLFYQRTVSRHRRLRTSAARLPASERLGQSASGRQGSKPGEKRGSCAPRSVELESFTGGTPSSNSVLSSPDLLRSHSSQLICNSIVCTRILSPAERSGSVSFGASKYQAEHLLLPLHLLQDCLRYHRSHPPCLGIAFVPEDPSPLQFHTEICVISALQVQE